MCSELSAAMSGKSCGSWEDEFWDNLLSPNHNACDPQNQIPNTQGVQNVSVGKYNTSAASNHVQVHTPFYQSSTLLSPTWDESPPNTQSSTFESMSSYFANFDPTTSQPPQFSNIATNQAPVIKIPSDVSQHNDARMNFVPSNNGMYKAVVKRKRKRTVFTTEQVEALEEVFAKRPYVTREERQTLVKSLNVNDKSVKIWFQNRRLKNKRGDEQETTQSETHFKIFERLNSVESKLLERVDESGYVTLDDKIMSELVNVIDDYFTNKTAVVEPKEEVYSPIYEPISPASSTDNDCGSSWDNHNFNNCKNNNAILDLMDIESIISM